MHRFDPTTPAGRLLLSVDFTELLPQGASLTSADVEIAVHSLSPADDPNVSDCLDGAAFIAGNGVTVSQMFAGGIENVDYVLTFIATFSDGEVEPVEVELPVRRFI